MRAEGATTAPELVESLLDRAERVVIGQRENLELGLLALLCPGSRKRLSDLPTGSRPRNRRAPGGPIWYPLVAPERRAALRQVRPVRAYAGRSGAAGPFSAVWRTQSC